MRPALYLLLLCVGSIGAADTLGEQDAMVINPLNGSDFEVVETRRMGAADFWCGAATFVTRRQGLSELTPIYVKRPRAASQTSPGRKAVTFTTDGRGLPAARDRLTLEVDAPGIMLKSARARRYCRDAFTRSTK
jgi:hypothetical protein